MEKEKDCCPECRPIDDDYECHPWDTDAEIGVVALYERIYDKASELTQRDAKLSALDPKMFRGVAFMHIDNMLKLYGCADLLDDNLP